MTFIKHSKQKNKDLTEIDSVCKIDEYGTKIWRNSKGERHRLDGPAVEYLNGSKYWYQNDKLHRLDGPAIEWANGNKEWWQNNKRHRLDEPAVEYENGDKEWWQNGKLHRLDGPAVEWANGDKEWWVDGKKLTKEELNNKQRKLQKDLKMKYLSNRMKSFECVWNFSLMKKSPVILRIDGKNFSKWTKPLVKPYSKPLMKLFAETSSFLLKKIDGARMAYTQSDEISILLCDWNSFATEAWFNNRIQKLCSVTSSLATAYFNEFKHKYNLTEFPLYCDKKMPIAFFDCRAFNIPYHEVQNYFVWRQQDCIRNSVTMLAQKYFSHKQLHKKNTSQMKKMLLEKFDVDWAQQNKYFCYGQTLNSIYLNETDVKIFKENPNFIKSILEHKTIKEERLDY